MPPRFRVLVLDSDASNRRLVSLILRSAGHEVLEAERVDEVRELCASIRVDLLLAEATIPGLEGIFPELAPHFPVILMSPFLSGALRERVRLVGAVSTVHRPVFVDELRAAVTAALPGAAANPRAIHSALDERATAA